MGKKFTIIDYGRRLERLLAAQRDVSSIIQHRGEIGAAREFFVESILKRFLPPNINIGRGEIVDGTGNRSRQQDLLLYRSNFPVMDSLAGFHIYLAEGVLATIEVKSNLDEQEIIRATDNIKSVKELALSPYGLGEGQQVEGAGRTLDDLAKENVSERIWQGHEPILNREDPLLELAHDRIWTYVFAFGSVDFDTLTNHASNAGWLQGDGPDCLCVLGSAFGARFDDPIGPLNSGEPNDVFQIDETSEPLGWWLGHIIRILRRKHREPVLRPYFE